MKYIKLIITFFCGFFMLTIVPTVFAANVEVVGRVSSGNYGSQGSNVLFKDTNTKQIVGQTTVDPSGVYSISVPKGTYDIVIVPPSQSHIPQVTKSNQTVSSDSVVNVALPNMPANANKNYIGILLIIGV